MHELPQAAQDQAPHRREPAGHVAGYQRRRAAQPDRSASALKGTGDAVGCEDGDGDNQVIQKLEIISSFKLPKLGYAYSRI
jgi:hypothetical protein